MIDIKKYLTNLLPTEDETLIRDLNTYSKSIPLEKELDFADSGLPIKIQVGAQLKVENIEPNSSDSREFLGKLTQDNHYLTHGLEVSANMVAGHSGDQIKAALETATFLHTFYGVKHHGNTQLGNAIKADWSVYKTFFRKADLTQLEEGNILGVEWQGTLNASAAFSWSNAVGRSLNSIAKLLNYSGVVDVEVLSGIQVGFDVSFSDHYILAVKRLEGERFQLKVLKKKNSNRAFSLTAGVKVEFKDATQAGNLVSDLAVQLLEKISGHKELEIFAALKKVDERQEEQKDKKIVDLVLKQLPENIRNLTDISLTSKYERYKSYLSEKITEKVSENIQLSLGYQYSRVKESEEMLSCELSLNTLEHLHSNLRFFNIRPLLDAILENHPDIKLNSYLKMESLLIKKSWGLSLNIFGFSLRSNADTEEHITTRTNIEGQQQISDHRLFAYRSKLGNYSHHWGIAFQADMPDFSADKTPKLHEFGYSLSLFHNKGLKMTDAGKLRELLDTTFLWGGYKQADIDQLIHPLYAETRGRKIEVNTQLQFSNEATRSFIHQLGVRNFRTQGTADFLRMLGDAFGAAMPYWDNFTERRYPEIRKTIYGPVWSAVLKGNLDVRQGYDFSRANHLRGMDLGSGFVAVEREIGTNRYMTLADLNHSGGEHRRVEGVFNGFHALKTGIQNRDAYERNFMKAVNLLREMQSQSIYARSFGRLFVELLPPVLAKNHLEFTARIIYEDNEGKEVERILV